jgi:lysophospholipase L1-like esterase
MPERPRWVRRGLLAVAAAAVALASITIEPAVEPAEPPAAELPAAAPDPAPRPEPLRIMPLGSSSTVGTGSAATAGYRGPLEARLTRDHIAFDMVGSQRSGPASLADRDHEGHGGATMAQMQPFVARWVARQDPDLILLQVGTNDLLAGIGAVATAQRLDTMLTTIGAVSDAQVVVAGVWAPLPRQAAARAQYARLAPAVVARHPGATWVDTSALLAPTDLFDGLHPNLGGYRKIARLWERAIRDHLVAGGQLERPELGSTDMLAGFGASVPMGGISAPVATVARTSPTPPATKPPAAKPSAPKPPVTKSPAAKPPAPSGTKPPGPAATLSGNQPGPGRPDATGPLVRTPTDRGLPEGPGAVRAGHPPVPVPRISPLVR